MDPKESYKYMKWCNDNEILIYPVPIRSNGDSYNICVERDKVGSVGKLVFEDKPTLKKNSVWDQIRELYKIIYEQEKFKNHEKTN